MKNSQRLLLIAPVVFVLLIASDAALACSCDFPLPTVDVAAESTPNIALFKVESTQGTLKGSRGELASSATLVVERVFKGDLGPGERLEFSSEGLCTFQFYKNSPGHSYLLYLDKRPGQGKVWSADFCRRSGGLGATADDVLYLEKMDLVRGKTRLAGGLYQQIETKREPRDWYFESLAGVPVRIRGKGKDVVLNTDENGAYEIYGLRPGKYEIIVPEIKGFATDLFDGPGKPIPVEIRARKHSEENVYFYIHNSISGTLIDENGTPVAGSCLELVATSHTLPDYIRKTACTDAKGEFRFFEILSGTYMLVGNKENKITPRDPFPTYFYPGTQQPSDAQKFTFGPGVHFRGLVMRTPTFVGVVNVSGTMRYKDGTPVAKATVEFFSGVSKRDEIEDFSGVFDRPETQTDENGHFQIRIPKGQKGVLVGHFTAYKREYRNCPQITTIIKAGGFNSEEIETPAVIVDASSEVTGIDLQYPFRACKKEPIGAKWFKINGLDQ